MKGGARSVVLVCVLVLAGCSGFAGGRGGDDSAGSTARVTPAPVPGVEDARRLAPGVTDEGVTNASALVAAHEAIVRNTSATTRSNRTVEYANGTVRRRVTGIVRVGRNRSTYDARYAYTMRPSKAGSGAPTTTRIGYWSNGERAFQAVSYANGTTRYGALSADFAASIRRSTAEQSEEYEQLLIGTDTRVVDRAERNGTTVYRLEASDPAVRYPGSYSRLSDRRNATFGLVVDERGLIRRHRFAYAATTQENATVRVIERVQYGGLNETTVERPPWYEAAVAATNGTTPDANEA